MVVSQEKYTTRISVLNPPKGRSNNGQIRAIVRITTVLPAQMQEVVTAPEMTVVMNRYAALGALTWQRNQVFVGSRLTVYEAEDSWKKLHVPLLLLAVLSGTEAILGAIRRSLYNENGREGNSAWTADDLEQVNHYLSQVCICTVGRKHFTAEIGLEAGNVSATAGHHATALLELMNDEPHPELGGGLFCLLQMPHRLKDHKELMQICVQLNTMEMEAQDQPPHFGAWCAGTLGDNPAYVSFYPNFLHSVDGIAVNAATWAVNRAEWSNRVMESLGVHL